MLEFYDKHYGVQKEMAKELLMQIANKKNIIDYRESNDFFEYNMKRDYCGMPILSTGGYNDQILRFVSHLFNTEVIKCREFIPFVTIAIDYLNKYTNDCFFKLDGKMNGILNHTGKIKQDCKPK